MLKSINKVITVFLVVAGLSLLGLVLINKLKKTDQEREVPQNSVSNYSTDSSTAPDTSVKRKIKVVTLTEDNSVELLGEVSYGSVRQAVDKLKKLAKNEQNLYLVITSPGGDVFSGMILVETIQGSKAKINTVCVGMCASMAAQIHSVGYHRYMTDRAVLMFHPASGGVQGEVETMSSRVNFIKAYIDKSDAYIAERAGIDFAEFKKKVRNEFWLDADQATLQGFNDEVVYLEDERNTKPESVFSSSNEEGRRNTKAHSPIGTDRFFKQDSPKSFSSK